MKRIDDIVYAWDFIRENEVLDVPMVDALFEAAVQTRSSFEMYHVMKSIDEGVRALGEGQTFRKFMGVYGQSVNNAWWTRPLLERSMTSSGAVFLVYKATRKDGWLSQSLHRADAQEALEYIRAHFDAEGNKKQETNNEPSSRN